MRAATHSTAVKLGRDNVLRLVDALIEPMSQVAVLLALAFHFEPLAVPTHYYTSALVLFAVSFPGPSMLHKGVLQLVMDVLTRWMLLAGLLLAFLHGTHGLQLFPTNAIYTWLLVTPLLTIVIHAGFRISLPGLMRLRGSHVRAIIVGVNAQGLALAQNLSQRRDIFSNCLGFFDDRTLERIHSMPGQENLQLLGKLPDVTEYVRKERVQCVYLALPMTRQGRILALLDELKDTTASINFVPDIFVTDLIQGRVELVGNVPVVAICETPFAGISGLIKRSSDILLALLILLLISPLLVLIAIAVRLESPGPVIFKQRRYGLDGEEIQVYKFRSMTVTEDGDQVVQATRNDQRLTRLGVFLRKTSLDELPQFINVLEGKMSIVGPRPHAVAHNELYRRLIKGYMVRHKVKPGITGWAQVNGYRGETETVDKMQKRIDYDLDYLRNWSLALDLKIILRTILVVIKDQRAY